MITKDISLKLITLGLCSAMVIASCSSPRQVACPEPGRASQPVQPDYRKKVRTHRTGMDLADRISTGKITRKAGWYSRRHDPVRSSLSGSAGEPGESVLEYIMPAYIEDIGLPEPGLLASAAPGIYYGHPGEALDPGWLEIPAVTDDNPAPEDLSAREFRRFKKAIRKDLESAMSPAGEPTPQDEYEKPAIGFAIASLVLGILGLGALPFAASLLAIIFGGVALKRIRRSHDQEGRGMAIAGIILGIIGMFFSLIALVVGIVTLAVGSILSILFFWA
jgi:hypothetical protein